MPSPSGLPAHQRLRWRYELDADCSDSEESATRRWGILHSRLAEHAFGNRLRKINPGTYLHGRFQRSVRDAAGN